MQEDLSVNSLMGIGASPELLRPYVFVQSVGLAPSPSSGATVTVPNFGDIV